MAQKSHIEWTESTWNPVTGCNKVSQGCKFCYAERLAKRLKAMGNARYTNGFNVTEHPAALTEPDHWRKPRKVFVNSMSDLFHKDVSDDFIIKVFEVMNRNPRHQFQVLTKRSDRLVQLAPRLTWSDNIWIGVSVEDEDNVYRIDDLRKVQAKVRFISYEPLVGEIKTIDLTGIHWAIVGGESGPGARPMKQQWVRNIRDACVAAKVPFFFKQWGGVQKWKTGSTLDRRKWKQFPK